jgi:hypothetical protein
MWRRWSVRNESHNLPLQLLQIACFTLPDHQRRPSQLSQRSDVSDISLRITFHFACPEVDIGLRQRSAATILVPMPETSMDKYQFAKLWQNNVRPTRQEFVIEPEPVSDSVQQ